jgi:nitrite reductase/ring-hydroxylating ferredoxin subunit/uncharacterized membrane protein
METPLARIENFNRIDAIANPLAEAVHERLERVEPLKTALNGSWLGHPLHPVLTDIPVGAWTAALVMDASAGPGDQGGYGRATETAIAVGLAGAVGSAITGITDWSDTDGRSRRLGLVHGLINLTATSFYVASLLARRRGQQTAGRSYSAAGYALMLAGAYLGGSLVYKNQIGVDRAANLDLPDQFTRVARVDELTESQPKAADIGGTPIVLVRRGGEVFALVARCAHAGGPLAEGKIDGNTITCPWHGSTFDLATGEVVNGPSAHAQPCLHTRLVDGWVEVRFDPESHA